MKRETTKIQLSFSAISSASESYKDVQPQSPDGHTLEDSDPENYLPSYDGANDTKGHKENNFKSAEMTKKQGIYVYREYVWVIAKSLK